MFTRVNYTNGILSNKDKRDKFKFTIKIIVIVLN